MSESSSNIVTVHTSKHSEPGKTFQVDLNKLCRIGPLYYSCSPQSQFYTSPQKRTLLEQIARFLTPENIQKYRKSDPKLDTPLSFLGTFLIIFSRGASTPENNVFLIKNHCFLYKNAVVLANRCVQNYTHGPPSPHKLARRYTGLPAQ